ncbi:MAG: hypothetical protein FWD61_02335 [Phycisphaerales bacterium]|nr:hypothetical protein [Phycisphaerales bacterium]
MFNFAERIDRWTRFISNDNSPRSMRLVRFDGTLPPMPFPRPDNLPARIEWAWASYEHAQECMTWLDDDALPYLRPYTGTEVFAEAFGCPVHYPTNDMPSARPLVSNAHDASRLRIPTLDHPAIARIFAITDELRRRAPTALMRLPDIQSPVGIAALIWQKEDFFAALMENPNAAKELISKCTSLMISFLDEWFARYGRSFIAHWPDYYMPYGITLSEDEIGAVSPDIFHQFFLPELAALSNRYGGIGIHCCANSRHQWPAFKQIPNLKLIQLARPFDQTLESLHFFVDHCAQYYRPETIPASDPRDRIPPQARIVLDLTASTQESAKRHAAYLRMAM